MGKGKSRTICITYPKKERAKIEMFGICGDYNYNREESSDRIKFEKYGKVRSDYWKYKKWIRAASTPNFIDPQKVTLQGNCLNQKSLSILDNVERQLKEEEDR